MGKKTMDKLDQKTSEPRWLTSNQAKAELKVSGCHLMHLRIAGKLHYKKLGNRYFYLIPVEQVN